MGRHGDDRQAAAEGRVAADAVGGLIAVHNRHLDIHQHDVERSRTQNFQRLFPMLRDSHQQSDRLEQFAGHQLVVLVVLHQQDTATTDMFQACQPGLFIALGLVPLGILLAEGAHDHIEQARQVRRLGQASVQFAGLGQLCCFRAAVGGGHDDLGERRQPGYAPDALDSLKTVHVGHDPVHDHQVIRLFGGSLPDPFDPLLARECNTDIIAERGKLALEDVAGHRAVVHHQHPHAAQIGDRFGDAVLTLSPPGRKQR